MNALRLPELLAARLPGRPRPRRRRPADGLPGPTARRDHSHGEPVTDAEAWAQMDVPGHETCVEVPQGKEGWFGGAAAG